MAIPAVVFASIARASGSLIVLVRPRLRGGMYVWVWELKSYEALTCSYREVTLQMLLKVNIRLRRILVNTWYLLARNSHARTKEQFKVQCLGLRAACSDMNFEVPDPTCSSLPHPHVA